MSKGEVLEDFRGVVKRFANGWMNVETVLPAVLPHVLPGVCMCVCGTSGKVQSDAHERGHMCVCVCVCECVCVCVHFYVRPFSTRGCYWLLLVVAHDPTVAS